VIQRAHTGRNRTPGLVHDVPRNDASVRWVMKTGRWPAVAPKSAGQFTTQLAKRNQSAKLKKFYLDMWQRVYFGMWQRSITNVSTNIRGVLKK